MNVEVVQRINKLAVELQKQGLATNRSDAISQAEKIFQGQGTIVPTSGYVSPVKGYDAPAPKITGLGQERIEQILEKNTRFLVATIKDFQTKMEAMTREIAMMKHKMASTANAPAPQTRTIPPPATVKTQAIPVQQQVSRQVPIQAPKALYPEGKVPQSTIQGHNRGQSPAAAQGSKSHPRVGKFDTDDVSIEKFFYAGSK